MLKLLLTEFVSMPCVLIVHFVVLLLVFNGVSGQDMYGAQYGNQLPDEARQRVRQMPQGYEEPNMASAGCPGAWQWKCDNSQCIAQYDLCDGIAQCQDFSDESEKNCRGMYPPHVRNNPYPPQPRPQQPNQVPEAAATKAASTTLLPKHDTGLFLPFKLILAGAGAFILLAGFGHVLMKRRQQLRSNIRNYRKGHSTVDDEDDLLISQMYS